jgi:branched-chain amino acid transport system substrate-binding protein
MYVPDFLGMGISKERTLLAQINTCQIFHLHDGWIITQTGIFEDIMPADTLRRPDYMAIGGDNIQFSRFNIGRTIERTSFFLRGGISNTVAQYLLVLSTTVFIFLGVSGRSRMFKISPQYVWFLQVAIAFPLLLSAEVALIDGLADKIDPYYQSLIVQIFSVLWWVIPAMLLNSAAEHFFGLKKSSRYC